MRSFCLDSGNSNNGKMFCIFVRKLNINLQFISLQTSYIMMTSSNGNIYCTTGPLWGESTSQCSPHKDQWRGTLMYSLICAWTNNWDTSNLRSHRSHYDVTVMMTHWADYIDLQGSHLAYRSICLARKQVRYHLEWFIGKSDSTLVMLNKWHINISDT